MVFKSIVKNFCFDMANKLYEIMYKDKNICKENHFYEK